MYEVALESSEHMATLDTIRFAHWPIGRKINVPKYRLKYQIFFFMQLVEFVFFFNFCHFRPMTPTSVIWLSVYRDLSGVSRMVWVVEIFL